MREYNPTDEENKIIDIMKSEVSDWEDGRVFVTDKVSYKMLGSDGIIQKSRKNYLGKFDEEKDEVTDKKKIFVPLTEDMVETIVKNIDLDSADINIRATNPNGYSSATILRYLLSYFMKRTYFGEMLNEMLRLFCIDGTIILKTLKNYDKALKKQVVKSRIVDATNFFIEPTENNIQEAGAVIERNVLTLSEAQSYPWMNLDCLQGSTDIDRLGIDSKITRTQIPYVEIYERWGELPKGCITGKEEDMDTWVPAIAIVSNLHSKPVVHKILENKKGIKPYEESRYRKIFGRWHGRGIGEILAGLQSYINETVNLRLNKARVSNLGLFKARKGSGITQQLLNSLVSGGVIPVTRQDDISELPISPVQPFNYNDEDRTYLWGQRATGAWDMGRGEGLPASMPATTAVLQERGMRSGMDLLQENLGFFLSKVFERHIIPLLIETLKEEDVVSIIGSPKDLKEIDEGFTNHKINGIIVDSLAEGNGFPPPDFLEHTKKMIKESLGKFDKTRYLEIKKDFLKNWKYEVEVFVTGESFNKAVMVKQLNDLLISYSSLPGINIDVQAVFKEALDLMGLSGARFMKNADEMPAVRPPIETPAPKTNQPRGETEMVGEANTAERGGQAMSMSL
jgi:hypothetical protein